MSKDELIDLIVGFFAGMAIGLILFAGWVML